MEIIFSARPPGYDLGHLEKVETLKRWLMSYDLLLCLYLCLFILVANGREHLYVTSASSRVDFVAQVLCFVLHS